MLEEKFVKKLINQRATCFILDITFNENIQLKGKVGPFKVNFKEDSLILGNESLSDAIGDGEGEVTGKNALKLLDKLSDAIRRRNVTEYDFVLYAGSIGGKHAINCDNDILHITEKGMRADYKKSEQKRIITLCEKGDGKDLGTCKYMKICPSYLAYKARKKLLFQKE